MKASELRGKSPEELRQQLSELLVERMRLRFQLAEGQVRQTHLMRGLRRDIARVRTVLRAHQQLQQKESR